MGFDFSGLGSAFDFGSKILDKVFPDPAEKTKAKQKLLELQQNGELQEIQVRMQAIVAEAKSEHWLTANWRPITMLTFVVIIANNYILAPYLNVLFDVNVVLPIPPEMWDLLKLGIGGYVVGRSVEKGIDKWRGQK